jgi:hypothetical protein
MGISESKEMDTHDSTSSRDEFVCFASTLGVLILIDSANGKTKLSKKGAGTKKQPFVNLRVVKEERILKAYTIKALMKKVIRTVMRIGSK